jgi:imidazolonepropionase-like amidohydrolase
MLLTNRAAREAVEFVEAAKAAGYDLIKMYEIDGEAFDSAVATARRLNIPIAGHPPAKGSPTSLDQVIRARYRSVEHLLGFPAYLERDASASAPPASARETVNGWPVELVLDDAKLRRIAQELARAGIWNCPTQVLYETFTWDSDTIERWPGARIFYGDSMLRLLRKDRSSSAERANARVVFETRGRIIKALHDAGAGLLLGTDVGVLGLTPGFTAHRELADFVAAGLTPYQALATGTRNVAAYFGTLDSAGTIAVGKRADLVLLNGNPLHDIRVTAAPAGVMLGGRWLSRAELDARLDTIKGTSD